MVTMNASFSTCGTSSFFQIFKKRRCRWRTMAVPPCLYTSAGMPSPPEALLHFICLTASICIISWSYSLTGTAGPLSRLSGSTWESRFSRSVNCSFHRHSICLPCPLWGSNHLLIWGVQNVSVSVRRSFWWQRIIIETCGCQHIPEFQQLYLSTTCPWCYESHLILGRKLLTILLIIRQVILSLINFTYILSK